MGSRTYILSIVEYMILEFTLDDRDEWKLWLLMLSFR